MPKEKIVRVPCSRCGASWFSENIARSETLRQVPVTVLESPESPPERAGTVSKKTETTIF
jgi:hypothetical protein